MTGYDAHFRQVKSAQHTAKSQSKQLNVFTKCHTLTSVLLLVEMERKLLSQPIHYINCHTCWLRTLSNENSQVFKVLGVLLLIYIL